MFFVDFDLEAIQKRNALSLWLLAVVNATGKFFSVRKLRRGQPKGRKFISRIILLF